MQEEPHTSKYHDHTQQNDNTNSPKNAIIYYVKESLKHIEMKRFKFFSFDLNLNAMY